MPSRRPHPVRRVTSLATWAVCLAVVGAACRARDDESPAKPSIPLLLQLTRLGGIAGLHDWLTIAADGEVRLTTNRGAYRETLPEPELRALREAIAKGDFELDSSKPPESPPPGWLEVLCVVYRDGKPVKVTAGRGPVAEVVGAIEKRAAAGG
jgi:hypothetical protein